MEGLDTVTLDLLAIVTDPNGAHLCPGRGERNGPEDVEKSQKEEIFRETQGSLHHLADTSTLRRLGRAGRGYAWAEIAAFIWSVYIHMKPAA